LIRYGDTVLGADSPKIAFCRALGATISRIREQEAYETLTKEQQRFWKRIFIVDDDADLITTFNAVIEESNYNNDVNKICQ
jgi:hypothetical protein